VKQSYDTNPYAEIEQVGPPGLSLGMFLGDTFTLEA
jgi:hypothetical protein